MSRLIPCTMDEADSGLPLEAPLPGPEPKGGVWWIHKHAETGELLGPSVPGGMPTRVVTAVRAGDGWREVG